VEELGEGRYMLETRK